MRGWEIYAFQHYTRQGREGNVMPVDTLWKSYYSFLLETQAAIEIRQRRLLGQSFHMIWSLWDMSFNDSGAEGRI